MITTTPTRIIKNHKTGQVLRILKSRKDTKGALLEMEATYQPHSPEPPAHYHPFQEEEFRVLSGDIKVQINGQYWCSGRAVRCRYRQAKCIPCGMTVTSRQLYFGGCGRLCIRWTFWRRLLNGPIREQAIKVAGPDGYTLRCRAGNTLQCSGWRSRRLSCSGFYFGC